MSVTSEMVRKMFKEGDDKRDEGLTTPENILRYDDICYGADSTWQKLDVYRPKDRSGDLPVIVSIHGGGWVYGDKERYQYYCMDLAKRGFAVINFTYRLAPEAVFPAPLEDTNLVFAWMMSNAKQYGLDLNSVFAVGDSAGAHILGLYTCIYTNPEYASQFDFKVPEQLSIKAIALNCGAYEITLDGGIDNMTASLMEDFLPDKGTQRELDLINVTHHITKDFPPVFFMTATGDFLIDQAKLLCQKFMKENILFQYHFYGDIHNPLGHVFHLNMKLKEASICNDEECQFFRKFINHK